MVLKFSAEAPPVFSTTAFDGLVLKCSAEAPAVFSTTAFDGSVFGRGSDCQRKNGLRVEGGSGGAGPQHDMHQEYPRWPLWQNPGGHE